MSKLVTLNDLGYVNRGRSKHRPRNAPELYGGPYPFVQTADIKHADLYLTEYEQTYSELGLAQSRLWPIGTLCITIAANIADTAILGCEACFPDSVIGFIPDEDKCDVRYVKYLFDTELQESFQQLSQGVAQDNLSKDKLLSVKFRIPDLPIQHRIADILSVYDDLIENNRRRIAILEETARLTYRKWFGGGEGRLLPLAEVADVLYGKDHKKIQDGDIPIFGSGGIMRYGAKAIYEQPSVLIPRKGTISNVMYVEEPFWTVDTMFYTRVKIPNMERILYYQLCDYNIASMSTGAAVPSMTTAILNALRIVVPPSELRQRFDEAVSPIFGQCRILKMQSAALVAARDMLLPRLMKGEVNL